ncbi:PIN domain-containing protein [Spirosoma humi]
MPYHHRDPFDRLIIAQAKAENLPIATKDQFFSHYGLTILW